ncbi:hypothetical protein A6A25_01010 [Saccharothrix sp. CB00851]|nr:hypothetical protein A6A25_01010 [Saccharothrix sp. CB00851]
MARLPVAVVLRRLVGRPRVPLVPALLPGQPGLRWRVRLVGLRRLPVVRPVVGVGPLRRQAGWRRMSQVRRLPELRLPVRRRPAGISTVVVEMPSARVR